MGESLRGIEISVAASAVPTRHVSGRVFDGATGAPAAGVTVRLLPRDYLTPSLVIPNGVTDDNGVFDIQGAMSAPYSLFVSGRVSAYMIVDVGNADVAGLSIVGTNGVDIPWRATLDGGSDDPAAIGQLRIILIRDPDIVGPPSESTIATAGFRGVPETRVMPRSDALAAGGSVLRGVTYGDYLFRIAGLPQGTFVKSVNQGRTDILTDGLHITGVPENRLEIVLGRNAGVLTGRVVNPKQESEPNVKVVLVPTRNRSRVDLYQSTSTDANGRFRFEGIPPDEYKLFAWQEVEEGAWHDPNFIRIDEGRGIPVDVHPGGNGNGLVEVPVIPWDAAGGAR
jgi:5-hydroxyisourate hydrolase-like protein (transthyretin family)